MELRKLFYELYDISASCKTNLTVFTTYFINNFPNDSIIEQILNYKKQYKDSKYDTNNYISHMLWISLLNAYHILYKNEQNIRGHDSLIQIRAETFDLLPHIFNCKSNSASTNAKCIESTRLFFGP